MECEIFQCGADTASLDRMINDAPFLGRRQQQLLWLASPSSDPIAMDGLSYNIARRANKINSTRPIIA